jgi:hypothetical protein
MFKLIEEIIYEEIPKYANISKAISTFLCWLINFRLTLAVLYQRGCFVILINYLVSSVQYQNGT